MRWPSSLADGREEIVSEDLREQIMRSGGHGRIVRHVFLSFGDAPIIRDELLVTFRALLGLCRFLRTIRIISLMEIQRGGVLVEILAGIVIRRIIRCYNRIRQQTVGSLIES